MNSKLLGRKTNKHEIQMLSCNGELKADERTQHACVVDNLSICAICTNLFAWPQAIFATICSYQITDLAHSNSYWSSDTRISNHIVKLKPGLGAINAIQPRNGACLSSSSHSTHGAEFG